MRTAIIILIILSASRIEYTYTDGKKSDFHWIPAIIALVLFCVNY